MCYSSAGCVFIINRNCDFVNTKNRICELSTISTNRKVDLCKFLTGGISMFYEIFKKLCDERGATPTEVALDMGISTSLTSRWKHGGMPRADTLQNVADHFGVSVSYLLGAVDDPDPIALIDPSKKDPPMLTKLEEIMQDMTAEELEDLERYAEFILSKKKG
jgi:transcriptional regulator with XRE-family HTH domain